MARLRSTSPAEKRCTVSTANVSGALSLPGMLLPKVPIWQRGDWTRLKSDGERFLKFEGDGFAMFADPIVKARLDES